MKDQSHFVAGLQEKSEPRIYETFYLF